MKIRKGLVATAVAVATAISAALFGVSEVPQYTEIAATQQIRYQTAPASWEAWGPGRYLGEAMENARDRLARHQGGSYRIKQKGEDEWSRLRNLSNTVAALRDKLEHAPIASVWLVLAEMDDWKLKARGWDYNPAAYFNHPDGTLAVDIVIGTLMKRHPELTIGGVYVCRPIQGSYTLSQHSYGNAVDVFGTYSQMRLAAYDMLDLGRAGYVPVSQILWDYQNLFTGHYVYDHTNHVHFSGDPLQSGSCRRP